MPGSCMLSGVRGRLRTLPCREVLRHPVENLDAMPSYRMTTESLLFRETSENAEGRQYPPVPPSKPGDVMGGKNFVECRKTFIDSRGERYICDQAVRYDARSVGGFDRAHGFLCSCAVPVASGRVVTG